MHGQELRQVLAGQDISIRLHYVSALELPSAKVLIAFNVRSNHGYLLANLNSVDTGNDILPIYREGYFECKWNNFNLRSGSYDCAVFCSINGEIADWLQSAFTIQVEDGDFYGTGRLIAREGGDVLIRHSWSSHPGPDDHG
jgi:lipopolysaccharide transport system ATP-binding protein